MEKENHRTTARVIEILDLISNSSSGLTLTEISSKINAPKSSIHPILKTLSDSNFLKYDTNSFSYRIGYKAFEIGNSFLANFNIMAEVKNSMINIVNICSETCHFAVLIDGDVLYLQKIDSPEPIRMMSTLGKRIPAYGTGLGKALLIDYEINQLKKLYSNGLSKLTKNTIASFEELYNQLKQARSEGFAYEIEESNEHIRCIAIPIRRKGTIVAALSVAIPVFRYSEEKAELIRHLLKSEKEKIENLLDKTQTDFSLYY